MAALGINTSKARTRPGAPARGKSSSYPLPNRLDALAAQIRTAVAQVLGPDSADNVVVTDALPAGLTYKSSSPSAGAGSYNSASHQWAVGTLAGGASAINTSAAELATLQLRAEFFNVFNIVNLGLPANILLGPGFGVINRTAGPSRQVQFSLKVVY